MARKSRKESTTEPEASDAYDDSDALDSDVPAKPKASPVKAKRKEKPPPKKRRRKEESEEPEALDTGDDDVELEDGQTIVGRVIKAPTKGKVPAGQISQNTFDFLSKLTDPACNDRDWFKIHDPVFRQAEKEFKDFVDAFAEDLTEVDEQVPPLPAKDTVHRIYRDVRFSNDKTPYKTGFSASFSRSGRKGIFAGCQVRRLPSYNSFRVVDETSVKPGGKSVIAAGSWCPAKAEIANIRANIIRSPARLLKVISDPEFVQYFGEPSPVPVKPKKKKKPTKKKKDDKDDGKVAGKKRKATEIISDEEDAVDTEDEADDNDDGFGNTSRRRNIFGMGDELKNGPTGIPKDHKSIDLLKCRSFAVVHRFMDSEVVAPDFKEALAKVAAVMQPLVHCLNDMMTIQPSAEDEEEEEEEEEGDDEG